MTGILIVWGIIGGVIALFGYLFLHLYENFFIYLFVFSGIAILMALLKKNEGFHVPGGLHVLRTYNIDFESSRKIQKLFSDIEDALTARVGAGNVKRLPGGISVMVQGIVKAKFIPWKNSSGNEFIMLGISSTIENQDWGDYKFPEKYLIGVGGNEQPFYFMTLPQDQTANEYKKSIP